MTAPEPPDPGTAAAPALPAPSRPAHRWGIPAALAVLAVNLVGFTLGPILAGEGFVAETYVLAIMAPTLLAGAAALAFSVWRGCGPVADFGLPRSWAEFRDQLGVGLLGGGDRAARRVDPGGDPRRRPGNRRRRFPAHRAGRVAHGVETAARGLGVVRRPPSARN